MNQEQYRAVHVLNGLIETTIDSVQGYEQAAQLALNPRFKDMFEARAMARRELTGELETQVRASGGRPLSAGSVIGPIHRAFLSLRDRISGQTDRPVIEEVERGEAFILGQFDKAAHDESLPEVARHLVTRAGGHIREDHDEITGLRAEFH